MKLKSDYSDVVIDGSVEKIECSLDMTSKVLDILIDAYRNPLLALIRELIINAIDSVCKSREGNLPVTENLIEVGFESAGKHIKTSSPMFYVRDYGTGISAEGMEDYAKIGRSTKNDSNTETGCFGIGSKAPLAYSDKYFLECYDGKEMRKYCVTRNESGGISILNYGSIPSDEPRGVRVSVPIKDNDTDRAKRFVKRVCQAVNHPHSNYQADVYPQNVGSLEDHRPIKDNLTRVTDFVYIANTDLDIDRRSVLMGNVQYPVDLAELLYDAEDSADVVSEFNAIFSHNQVVFCVPMGDENDEPYLSFPPSRDTIKTTDRGRDFMISVVKEANQKLLENMQKELDAQPNLIAAGLFTIENKQGYSANVIINRCEYKGVKMPTSYAAVAKYVREVHAADMQLLKPTGVDNRYYNRNTEYYSNSHSSLSWFKDATILLLDEKSSYKKRIENDESVSLSKLAIIKDLPPVANASWDKLAQELTALGMHVTKISQLDKYSPKRVKRDKVERENSEVLVGLSSSPYCNSIVDTPEKPPTDESGETAVIFKVVRHDVYLLEKNISGRDRIARFGRMLKHWDKNYYAAGIRPTVWKGKDLPRNCRWSHDVINEIIQFRNDNLWLWQLSDLLHNSRLFSGSLKDKFSFIVNNGDALKISPWVVECVMRYRYIAHVLDKCADLRKVCDHAVALVGWVGVSDQFKPKDYALLTSTKTIKHQLDSVADGISERFQYLNYFRRAGNFQVVHDLKVNDSDTYYAGVNSDIVHMINAAESRRRKKVKWMRNYPQLPEFHPRIAQLVDQTYEEFREKQRSTVAERLQKPEKVDSED